ncbi:hypothetical protein M0804_009931 [Polistes exclamans]|nr:hypothetical protein M0804_009931 [Polistes exclamans]
MILAEGDRKRRFWMNAFSWGFSASNCSSVIPAPDSIQAQVVKEEEKEEGGVGWGTVLLTFLRRVAEYYEENGLLYAAR